MQLLASQLAVEENKRKEQEKLIEVQKNPLIIIVGGRRVPERSNSTQEVIVLYHDDLKMYRVIFDDGLILHYAPKFKLRMVQNCLKK